MQFCQFDFAQGLHAASYFDETVLETIILLESAL